MGEYMVIRNVADVPTPQQSFSRVQPKHQD